jgi:GrpB-like predicted nucleotidyltransferase (UPF0157 family)
MLQSDSLALAIVEQIRIVPHDPQWSVHFAAEKARLLDLLPSHFAAIEHIGSTAVPGLAAKPIIDIIAGVGSMGAADALLEPLCANGYETSAEFNATLPDRRWLMRHAFGKRTHHLHLVVFGSELWIRWLQFRDLLRADVATAKRYEDLKEEHAEKHRDDREAYTRAKKAFIDEACRRQPRGGEGLCG